MRVSIIATFIFPLAALAAPNAAPNAPAPAPDKKLELLFETQLLFEDATSNTIDGLDLVHDSLPTQIDTRIRQAVINAGNKLGRVSHAARKVGIAMHTRGALINDDNQFVVIRNTIEVQSFLLDLSGAVNTNSVLKETIRGAVVNVGKMILLECTILRLQKKTVRELYENFHTSVPPGFDLL